MSDQLFEVTFEGRIRAGANRAAVREKVGKMFNAGEAQLDRLFSGKPVVVKTGIDAATAAKYRDAFKGAGAECSVRPVGGQSAPATVPPTAAPAAAEQGAYTAKYSGDSRPPPSANPLGIAAANIASLDATVAPAGSDLQHEYAQPDDPLIDISGLSVSDDEGPLSTGKRKAEPPPPDVSGITLADDD